MKSAGVNASKQFLADLKKPALRKLVDNIPKLRDRATVMMDGRQQAVVLVVIRDTKAFMRSGIEVQLFDKQGKTLLDLSRTDRNGIVLLKFPVSHQKRTTRTEGLVRLSDQSKTQEVSVPPFPVQHTVVTIALPELPIVPPLKHKDLMRAMLDPLRGDNPLERLPSDFTTTLCDTLTSILPTVTDPIFNGVLPTNDFRSQRTPILKRLTIPRVVAKPVNGGRPRRFLVRARQVWTFMGYSLGELATLEALDPGKVIKEAQTSADQLAQTVSRLTDYSTTEVIGTLKTWLNEISGIDSVVNVATNIDPKVVAGLEARGGVPGALIGGGLGLIAAGPLGAILGGLLGSLFSGPSGVEAVAGANVATTTGTSTDTDTSLEVNSRVRIAQSVTNQAKRKINGLLEQAQSLVSRDVGQVSPLLSRVTNLVHWTMYENYIVCNHIEDVFEIEERQFVDMPSGPIDMPVYFNDEDIVEFRPFFQPALLEPQLAQHFGILRDAIQQRLAGGLPVSRVIIAIDYSAFLVSADLVLRLGASEVVLRLSPGITRTNVVLNISPVLPSQLGPLECTLSAVLPRPAFLLGSPAGFPGGVTVSAFRIWFNGSASGNPTQEASFTTELAVTSQSASVSHVLPLLAPPMIIDTTKNPLFRHVNRNHTYYMGVLAQAALTIPSLRTDAVNQLAGYPYEHELWRLPILKFEGDRVLLLKDVDHNSDPDVVAMLQNDAGAATVMQLAVPGAYGEALKGALSILNIDPTALVNEADLIHPALQLTPAPVMTGGAVAGPPGATGPAGPQGVPGPPGPQGLPGV